MSRRTPVAVAWSLLLLCTIAHAAQPKPDRAQASTIAVLEEIGGKVEIDQDGRVTKVRLRSSQVTDDDLKILNDLPDIYSLDLFHTSVRDAGLAHVKGLRKLRALDLRNTDVTDGGLKHLEGLPELRILHLGHRITDKGLVHLAALRNLETLNLESRYVTDEGLKYLSPLTNLKCVDLRVTSITDAGVVHLDGMTELRTLRLASQLPYPYENQRPNDTPQKRGPRLSDKGLINLKSLKNLEYLDLNNSDITDEGLEHLKDLAQLKRLSLVGTAVTNSGVVGLKESLPNLRVDTEASRRNGLPYTKNR